MTDKEYMDLLEDWRFSKIRHDLLSAQVRAEGMKRGKSFDSPKVWVRFSNGIRRYDYQGIAKEALAPKKHIDACSALVTDWKRVCSLTGISEELMQKHCSTGSPSISILVKNEEPEGEEA
jgi:hypothetical protein